MLLSEWCYTNVNYVHLYHWKQCSTYFPISSFFISVFLVSISLINLSCVLIHFSRVRLCDPMDCSLPGSSVHGILQAWILEWVAFPFSRGSSWLRKSNLNLLCLVLWQAGSLPLAPPGSFNRSWVLAGFESWSRRFKSESEVNDFISTI